MFLSRCSHRILVLNTFLSRNLQRNNSHVVDKYFLQRKALSQKQSHSGYFLAQFKSSATRIDQVSQQRPPRFYVPEPLGSHLSEGSLVKLPLEEALHATRTLRMTEGSLLEVCDGLGSVAIAELHSIGNSKKSSNTVVRLVAPPQTSPLDSCQWTLAVACGSLKGGRADWIIEKAVELGAASFQPLITERSPVIGGGDGGSSGREGRWHRVAIAAMKQCLRTRAMHIENPCSVLELTQKLKADPSQHTIGLVGAEGAPPIALALPPLSLIPSSDSSPLHSSDLTNSDRRIHKGFLIVGPEGDFTPDELNLVLNTPGVQPVGLGPLRLRTETAALAMLSCAQMSVVVG